MQFEIGRMQCVHFIFGSFAVYQFDNQ